MSKIKKSKKVVDEKEIKSKINEGYIYSRVVLEIVGKPRDYVEDSLKEYLKKIEENKNYIITKEDTEEAIENENNLFSAFSELEILFKNTKSILDFIYDYMPSSIEIIEPETILLKNFDFTNFLNDLLARNISFNNSVLQLKESNLFYIKNTAVLLRNFLIVLLSNKPMTLDELNAYMGVKKEDIEKVLNVLITEKKVEKKDNFYKVVVHKNK
ncbi:MAG: hypothetical protein QXE31_00710 [Candidatus Woesearchaeota archaeon]